MSTQVPPCKQGCDVHELTTEERKQMMISKTTEDGDGNVGKTIKLITQDKKRT